MQQEIRKSTKILIGPLKVSSTRKTKEKNTEVKIKWRE